MYDLQVKDFDADITLDLAQMLGVKSFRLRLSNTFANSDGTYDTSLKNKVDKVVSKMNEFDIEPIGQAMVYPDDSLFKKEDNYSVPTFNDPNYSDFMNCVYLQWKTIASCFPDIKIWEMGNESNASTFFHPNGYQGSYGQISSPGEFSQEESAKVLTDYMFYASKGIHEGNPNARSLMPGLTSFYAKSMSGIQGYIELIYKNIKSNQFPSKTQIKSSNIDDYFNIIGWHPYTEDVDEGWLNGQQNVYSVVKENNDEGRPVIYTEFGFSDYNNGSLESQQIGYFAQAYQYILEDLPFVEKVCAFRMYNCAYAEVWGGLGETAFGHFKEPEGTHGFEPKNKAIMLQELYGGEGNLFKYY